MNIAEVSQKFELSPDTLRYYERIGLIPPVTRRHNGIRDYSEEDCQWVQFVKCMRAAGLPVEVLSEYIALFQQGEATIQIRKGLLVEQRAQLMQRIDEMKKMLARLNVKIERYEQAEGIKLHPL